MGIPVALASPGCSLYECVCVTGGPRREGDGCGTGCSLPPGVGGNNFCMMPAVGQAWARGSLVGISSQLDRTPVGTE